MRQKVAKASQEETFKLLSGLNKYHCSQIKPHGYNAEEIWSLGSSKVYSYSDKGAPILFVPSLINKPHILDLSSDNSFLLKLSDNTAPYLLDWGAPEEEKSFSIEDYINKRLFPAIDYITEKIGKPITLAGYCMGGFLSLAAAQLKPDQISSLISIATPWDFNIPAFPKLDYSTLLTCIEPLGIAPYQLIQMMFYLPHAFDVNRKFIDFADDNFDEEQFLQIENWVNDGVDISLPVLKECLIDFIGHNKLMKKEWRVNDQIIDPSELKTPILCAFTKKDKITPYESTFPLVKELQNSTTIQPDCGHIGMIVGKNSIDKDIVSWLNNIILRQFRHGD